MQVIPRKTWKEYESEVAEYNERTRQAIAAFHKNEPEPRKLSPMARTLIILLTFLGGLALVSWAVLTVKF